MCIHCIQHDDQNYLKDFHWDPPKILTALAWRVGDLLIRGAFKSARLPTSFVPFGRWSVGSKLEETEELAPTEDMDVDVRERGGEPWHGFIKEFVDDKEAYKSISGLRRLVGLLDMPSELGKNIDPDLLTVFSLLDWPFDKVTTFWLP